MRLSVEGQEMTGHGWTELALAFALFLVSHSVPVRPSIRKHLVALIGERPYLLIYSLTSTLALGLLIWAAGRAPYVELWSFQPWQIWAPQIAMVLACLLIAFGIGAPNPLSFGGGSPEAFDPDTPGIAGAVRHPLLWALVLWALSHAVPNGDLAHVLVFGGFAVFALAGMFVIDRRLRNRMGEAVWQRLAARTSWFPFVALIVGRWRPNVLSLSRDNAVRMLSALALYVCLAMLHQPVIGVAVTPDL
jgi:uncharacterized membrane protein